MYEITHMHPSIHIQICYEKIIWMSLNIFFFRLTLVLASQARYIGLGTLLPTPTLRALQSYLLPAQLCLALAAKLE